ncbi:MAG TPA: CBS domain-containing protein, partial [Nitrospirota bacterium]
MIGVHIKDIASGENTHITGSASLRRLIELMNANGKGVVVVVEDGKPVGIVTERDIVDLLYRGTDLNEEAGRYARKQLIMTTGDRTIGYALNLLLENSIRRIIVTDKSGDFIGVLTQKDMIRHLEEDFYRGALKAEHILDKLRPLISVAADDPLRTVIKKIVENRISAVPVLEEGAVVGIISEKDLLKVAADRSSLDKPASDF